MVSIVVPCLNEKDRIEMSLRSILAQEMPPGGFEIIVADGFSTDGSRAIVKRMCSDHPEVRLVDNAHRTTPCAMNVGINEARGRYVGIFGAHTEYARDYIRTCVELLN